MRDTFPVGFSRTRFKVRFRQATHLLEHTEVGMKYYENMEHYSEIPFKIIKYKFTYVPADEAEIKYFNSKT